jgi:putative ABC transport system substrate-binding protein
MKRREFIVGLAGGAVWPLAAQSQSLVKPVIGFLNSGESTLPVRDPFRRGLGELGLIEGRDLNIEYRFAEGHYDRLESLATDLVRQQVSVIGAFGGVHTAIAAKAATASIPIVFSNGSDPVRFGLVASLNRPGGNLTGISFLTTDLESKRLGLLHELISKAKSFAVLVNPRNANAENQLKIIRDGSRDLGRDLHVISASGEVEFNAAFAAIARTQAGGLLVAADPLFFSQRLRLVALSAEYSIPTIYDFRQYAEHGGLASYGTDLADAYRHAGIYVARILKGEKPAELPVMQSAKFEFVINLKTAKSLALEIPPTLLARADEVIE